MKSCLARSRISGSSLEGREAKRQIWVSNTHTHERRQYESLSLISLKHFHLNAAERMWNSPSSRKSVCLSICKRHKPKHTHTNRWNAAKLCDYERLRCLSGVLGQCVRSKEFTQITNTTPEQVQRRVFPTPLTTDSHMNDSSELILFKKSWIRLNQSEHSEDL